MANRILLLNLLLLLAGAVSCSKKQAPVPPTAEDTVKHIPYGNNPQAGKYVQSGDARIYYEVYGEGPPLLLLHGDFYGYIDEFEQYYPILSRHFKVIAVGRRGHGKSEMGHTPFTEKLFADDALAALQNEKIDSALVMGFSAGATTAYYLAAHYPERVVKVVALAGALNSDGYRKGVKEDIARLNFTEIEANSREFIEGRKKLMPEPGRYGELLEQLKAYWVSGTFVEEAKARAISCPVLVVTGDRDYYYGVDVAIAIQKTIPNAQLAIIPGCDHVGLILRPEMLEATVIPFLRK